MGDCFVCGRPAVPLSAAQRKSSLKAETFEDQLVVVYFFQKFFNVPLLEESSEGCNADEDVSTLENLLKSLGNPVEWVNFCRTCCQMIRRAKGLHDQLMKIEMQLKDLRTKIEGKILRSHAEAESADKPLKYWARQYTQRKIHEKSEITCTENVDKIENASEDHYEDIIIPVKLEPIEIDPYESLAEPSPLFFEIQDVKLESESESFDSLNIDECIIDPLMQNTTEACSGARNQNVLQKPSRKKQKVKSNRISFSLKKPSDSVYEAKSKTRKRKGGGEKVKTSKPLGKTLTSKSDIPAEDSLEHGNSPLVDQMDTSIRFKDDFSESEAEMASADDNSEDSDYDPEPELPGADRNVRLPRAGSGRRGVKKRGRIYPVAERTCPICQEVICRSSLLKDHINARHTKKILFTCDICQKGFYSKPSYTTHSRKHLSSEQIKHLALANKLDAVKVDGIVVTDSSSLELETAECSEEIVNEVLARTCSICKRVFTDKKTKEVHVESVHATKRDYVCDKCGKAFVTQSYLDKHYKRHEITVREFKCDHPGCTLMFKFFRDVRAHKKLVHWKQFERLCPQCGQKLGNDSALKRHILRMHTENAPKNFKCKICPKEFLTQTNLLTHMKCRSHGGPGLKKRKWIPKHIRLQMKIAKGLIPPHQPQEPMPTKPAEMSVSDMSPHKIDTQATRKDSLS